MNKQTFPIFHLPVREYSPIDSLNRRAAALGSVGYAQSTSHASYNGHHVSVWWNDYRGYYITEHYWGGRVVHARGSFQQCLEAGLREYNRGDLGASVTFHPNTEADVELCRQTPGLVEGNLPAQPEWYTWRHECAARAARDSANPRMVVMIFDWGLMQAANSEEEYEAALKAKHGRAWT